MQVTVIKTHKITDSDKDILAILDKYISKLSNKSVVAVTSKIISICESRIIKKVTDEQKDELVKQEADYYLPREQNQYKFLISIKRNIMIASAGIDESNGNGYYVLWPKDPQKTANQIREHLIKKFQLKYLGVIITDSKTSPMRWGVTGVTLSHSGFEPINSYVGKPDIFGRKLHYETVNAADALASSAVLVMGEGNEQTPLAIIKDIPFVHFQNRNPTKKELGSIKITLDTDVYSQILKGVKWQRGQNKS